MTDRIRNINEEIALYFEQDRFRQQIAQRSLTVTPELASTLGRAYATNPNVNPEIIAAITMSGADPKVLQQISEIAAEQQMRDGYGMPSQIGQPYAMPNGPIGASLTGNLALMQENGMAQVARKVDEKEEGGDDGILGWLHDGLKSTVRGAMVVSESGWQATEAFIRGVTDFEGETDLSLGDVFRNTSLYEVFRQATQENEVDLGSGYFSGGTVRENQARRQREMLGTVEMPDGSTRTWNSGLGFARALTESKMLPYNDTVWNTVSGIYSAAGAITFDPLNALGIGLAQRGATSVDNLARLGSRTANKVNRSIAAARAAEESGDLVLAMKYNDEALRNLGVSDYDPVSFRSIKDRVTRLTDTDIAVQGFLRDEAGFVSGNGERTVLIPEFVRFLTKDRGVRLVQRMVEETDTAKIFRLHQGKIGPNLVRELAQSTTPEEVIRAYAYSLGNPGDSIKNYLGYLPEMGFLNLPERGAAVRNLIGPYTRWFNYLPDSSILDPRDGMSYVNRAYSLYTTLPVGAVFKKTESGKVKFASLKRYDLERRDEMVRRAIDAFADGDPVRIKELNSAIANDFQNMFVRLGWSYEEATALTRWASDQTRLSQFSLADLQNPIDPATAPVFESQLLQSGATVIDPNKLQEVLRGSGRVRQMRRLNTKYHRLTDENFDLVGRITEIEDSLLLPNLTDDQKTRWSRELNELNRKQRDVQRRVDELNVPDDPVSRGFIEGAKLSGEYFMSQWWKPATLVRAAYILRIVPEEIARVTLGGVFGLGPGAFMDYILAAMGDINAFGRSGNYQVDALGNRFARRASESDQLKWELQDLNDELKVARRLKDEDQIKALSAKIADLENRIDEVDESAYDLFDQAMISQRNSGAYSTVTREVSGASLTDRRLMANMSAGKNLASRRVGAQRDKWVEGLADYFAQAAGDQHLKAIARVASGRSLPKSQRFAVNGVVGNWDEHVAAGRIRDQREGLIFWMQNGSGRGALDELVRSYAANGRVLDPENVGDVAFILDKQVEHLATLVGGRPADAAFSPSKLAGEMPPASTYTYTRKTASDEVPAVFHGTSASFEEGRLAQGSMFERQASGNLVGPGFYSTDSPDIANSYQRKGKGGAPNVYEARWVGENPPRIFDLNEPLSSFPDTQAFLRQWLEDNTELIDSSEELWQQLLDAVETESGTKFYELLYKNFAEAGIRRTDADEIVMDLNEVLSDTFDAMLHEGGIQGGAKHNVYVWLNEGNIEVKAIPQTDIVEVPAIQTTQELYKVIDDAEQDLVEAIATGRFDGSALKGYNRKQKDAVLNNAFRDRLKTFGDSDRAPERVLYNANRVNKEERFSFLRDRVVSPFFTKLYGIPSDKLARSPSFRRFYWLQMEQLIRSANDAAAIRLIDNAKQAGLPQNLLNRIIGAAEARTIVKGQGVNLRTLDEVAKGAALARVRDLLYDASRRGAAMDQMRLITPFGDAWKEVWSSWTKEVVRQRGLPVKRLAKGIQGVQESGAMEQDPITGEWHVTVPLSDKIARHMPAIPGLIPGGSGDFEIAPFTMPAQSLNVLGTFSPGVGPVLNSAVNSWIPDDPSWDGVRDWLFPVAEPAQPDTEAARNNLWQQLLFPSPWMRRAAAGLPESGPLGVLRNFVNDLESDPAFQATRNHVVQSLASSRPVDQTRGADNMKKLFDDANEIAKRMYFMRGLFAFIGPGAPMPRYIAETGQGNMPAALLTDEWRKLEQELLAAGQPPGLASQKIIDTYGENVWLYTASNSTSLIKGAQASNQWWDWYRSGGDQIVDKYPAVGAYFGETGDFSVDAYSSLFARGIYERKTGEELYNEGATDVAYLAYNKLRDQFPPESQRTREQRRLLASAREAIQKYWGVSLSAAERIEERDNQIREFERLIDSADQGDDLALSIMTTPTGRMLAEYMAFRKVVSDVVLNDLGGTSPTTFRQLRAAAPLRDAMRQLGERFSTQDSTFARIYQFVLEGELFDDEDQSDLQTVPRPVTRSRATPGRAGGRGIIPNVTTQAGG